MATSVRGAVSPVKISVLMAAYNAAPYLDDALRSVLAQRGVPFELLLGDDGSSDGTWRVIQRYQGDPRVRAWRWAHRGAGATRNRLIARARGRYLAICDADDLVLPGHLAALSRILDRSPQAGVAYSDLLLTSRPGKRLRRVRRQAPGRWDLLGWRLGHQGTLMRRRLVQRAGGYRADLPCLEDVDLFLRLSPITTFRASPRPLYLQRRHQGSLTSRCRTRMREISRHILREAIRRRYAFRVPW